MNDLVFAVSLLAGFVVLCRVGARSASETSVIGQAGSIAIALALARVLNVHIDPLLLAPAAWCVGGVIVAWLTGSLGSSESLGPALTNAYGWIVGLTSAAFFLAAITGSRLVISASGARWIVLIIMGLMVLFRWDSMRD